MLEILSLIESDWDEMVFSFLATPSNTISIVPLKSHVFEALWKIFRFLYKDFYCHSFEYKSKIYI